MNEDLRRYVSGLKSIASNVNRIRLDEQLIMRLDVKNILPQKLRMLPNDLLDVIWSYWSASKTINRQIALRTVVFDRIDAMLTDVGRVYDSIDEAEDTRLCREGWEHFRDSVRPSDIILRKKLKIRENLVWFFHCQFFYRFVMYLDEFDEQEAEELEWKQSLNLDQKIGMIYDAMALDHDHGLRGRFYMRWYQE